MFRPILKRVALPVLLLVSLSIATCAEGPLQVLAPWSLQDSVCQTQGDVPICDGNLEIRPEGVATHGVLLVDQDTPLLGKTSIAERSLVAELQFELDVPATVRIVSELAGILASESRSGAASAEAELAVLDASGALVENLVIRPAEAYFSQSIAGEVEQSVYHHEELMAELPAGNYRVQGTLYLHAEIGRGLWNRIASCDVRQTIQVTATGQEAAIEEAFDGQDLMVIPLGVEGSTYAHLEPGTKGGTVYVAAIGEPKGWNSAVAHESTTTRYTNMMHKGLVSFDPNNGANEPELARSWDISEDGLVMTLHLRRGLHWSDGEPFTADDVLFTYNDIIFNDDVDCDSRDILQLPDGNYPVFEKVDDYTVQVTMSTVFRPIINSLGSDILPKHKLAQYVAKLNPYVEAGTFNEAWTLDTPAEELVGMGPFMLEEYYAGSYVSFVPNPYYYHVDPNGVRLPYVDRYVVRMAANQDVTFLMFRNRELHAYSPRGTDLATLQEEIEALDITLMVDPDVPVFGTSWISINQDIGLEQGTHEAMRTMFRDLRFRKAIAHAIDKETIITNVYNGLAHPQWSPVGQPSPFYAGRDEYGGPVTENNAVVYEYDLDKAASLLDEIGLEDLDEDGWRDYPDGSRIEIEFNTSDNTNRNAVCQIVTDDLVAIGLKVTFQIVDFNTLVNRLTTSTSEMVLLGLGGGLDPNNGSNVYRSTGGLHFWHYSAADEPYDVELRIDELLSAGVSTYDDDEAFEYYKEYQLLYATQDLGLVFTVNPSFSYAFRNDLGNGSIANPIATPSGGNGLCVDLIYVKEDI